MKDDKANNFVGINLQNQLASKSLCSITAAADAGLVFQSKTGIFIVFLNYYVHFVFGIFLNFK